MISRKLTSGVAAAALVTMLAFAHATPAWGDAPPAPGRAQPSATKGQVDRLIAESRAMFQKGDSPAAAEKLLAAWQIEHTFLVAANLGTAELDLGRMRDAAEHLDYALREMPATTEKEKRDKLAEYFQKAKAAVGVLRLDLDPAGATVSLDGKALAAPAPATLYVDPGEHRLTAELSGRTRGVQVVKVGAGETKEVSLRLIVAPAAAKPAGVMTSATVTATPASIPAPPAAESRAPAIALWVLGSVGAASVGGYIIALGAGLRSTSTEHSGSDVLLGVGAGMLAMGIGVGITGILFERRASAPVTAVWVVPYADGRGGGLGVAARF